jgi:hypothetical protein
MLHKRLSPWVLLLFAVVGVSVLSLAPFRGPRPIPSLPFPQHPPELADDPRERRAHGEAAIEWRVMRMRDENGQIPDGVLMRAAEQMHAMRAAQAGQSRLSAASHISWTSIGPSNVGGRVRSIAIHPNDASTIFAGSVGGGIWKTTNGGASWLPVNDFMANLAVTSVVFTPTNPAVMYAATGEGLAGSRGIRGAGVFKSTDGGTTWNQLPSTANPSFDFTNRVAVSPDGTTVLAATLTGIYRSTDGGATFPAASVGGHIGNGIAQVVFDPNNSSRAVAGAVRSSLNPPAAWFSTDAGATWTPVTGLPLAGRVELAYARSVTNKVYASVNGAIPVGNRNQIFVSTNGGQSFTLATSGTSPNFLGVQTNWTNALWVDPTNDQHLIVGGIDLYRSTNGGSTLTLISGLIPGVSYTTHVDNHAIVSAPNYDGTSVRTVFLGNDGGVYKAADIATATTSSGWANLNNGLAITQFYSVATNSATGSIVGGTQDNATLRTSGAATTWSGASNSDGGFVAHDPVNTNYYYYGTLGLRIVRNETDGAGFGPEITGYWCDTSGCRCKSGALGALCQDWIVNHANFNPPVVHDPSRADRLLVGADHLFVTTDPRAEVSFESPTASGPSWFEIKPSTGQYISAVAVSPASSDIIAVGHNDGAVYVTTNGTSASPTWTRVDANATSLPDRMVTSITFSAASPNTLWVTFGGYNAQNIWESTDLGGGWWPISGLGATALPSAPVHDLKVLSANENSLYAATEIGLFSSGDGGATWMLPQDGPANVAVDQLAWLGPDTLVAATHGRGMFRATVDLSPPGCTVTLNPVSVNLGASAANASVTIDPLPATCAWTAVSNVPWLSVTSGSSGTGSGAVGYSALANPDTAPRRGAIRIAGIAFAVTQAGAPLTLQAPADLFASVVGTTVTTSWVMPPGIPPTGFVLEGGVSPGEVLASLPTGSTASTFTFSAPTGVFFIRMHALAGGARSAPSNEVRIAVNVPMAPAAPAALVGEAFGSYLRLAWRNRLNEGAPTSIVLDVSGAATLSMALPVAESFLYSGVPAGTYTFRVRATNAIGASPASNPVTLTFPTACVAAGTPADFAVTRAGNVISVSWRPAVSGPTPTGYVLRVTGALAATIPVAQTSVSGAVGPGTYTINVTATHPCGGSAPTSSQTVTIP